MRSGSAPVCCWPLVVAMVGVAGELALVDYLEQSGVVGEKSELQVRSSMSPIGEPIAYPDTP